MAQAEVLSGIPCKCGRWRHEAARAVVPTVPGAAPVYVAEQRWCPKCGNTGSRRFGDSGSYLLLFRAEFTPLAMVPVGLARLQQPTATAMRDALLEIRGQAAGETALTALVVEALVLSARWREAA